MKMEIIISEILKIMRRMDLVCKSQLVVPNIWVNGKMVNVMALVYRFIITIILKQDIGKMIISKNESQIKRNSHQSSSALLVFDSK